MSKIFWFLFFIFLLLVTSALIIAGYTSDDVLEFLSSMMGICFMFYILWGIVRGINGLLDKIPRLKIILPFQELRNKIGKVIGPYHLAYLKIFDHVLPSVNTGMELLTIVIICYAFGYWLEALINNPFQGKALILHLWIFVGYAVGIYVLYFLWIAFRSSITDDFQYPYNDHQLNG